MNPKFKRIWSAPVRLNGPNVSMHPFPGKALLRWVIVGRDVIYEGKTSIQALELIRALQKAKKYFELREFDTKQVIMSAISDSHGDVKWGPSNWPLWSKYHGKEADPNFVYFRKLPKNRIQRGWYDNIF